MSELSVTLAVSEIAVVRCMFDLTLFDMCAPSSSTSDDAIKGKWVRVPRDLNLQSGMWHLVRSLTLLAVGPNFYYCGTAAVLSTHPPTGCTAYIRHTNFPF